MAQPESALHGFGPVLRADTEVVLLGSFPSAASLAAGQYYAHPRNQFWPLMGHLLDEPLATLPYAARLERLLAHRVGLWDVVAACRRAGSLDSAIRDARASDLLALPARLPRLRAIGCNGAAAGRGAASLARAGVAVTVLPSSSPAHAGRSFQGKLALWRAWWAALGPGADQPQRPPRRARPRAAG